MKFNTDTENGVVLPLFNKRSEIINGTLVDTEDAEWLSSVFWYTRNSRNHIYAIRRFGTRGKDQICLRMPEEIARKHNFYIEGLIVDHINGDSLDNRKANLRMATLAQNKYNCRLQKNNSSGYCGVKETKQPPGRWIASIGYEWKFIHLGTFSTPEEAALAYNRKATEFYGEFAHLNEIRGE